MKTIHSIASVAVIVICSASFFGGYRFGLTKSAADGADFRSAMRGDRAFVPNIDQRRMDGSVLDRQRLGAGMGGGLASGEIISLDDQSLTIKLRSGSTQIVILSGETTVNKQTAGSLTDLAENVSVMITGTPNADGSVTAKSIQIFPERQAPIGNPGTKLPLQP